MQKKYEFLDDFGLRNAVIHKRLKTKSVIFIVVRVQLRPWWFPLCCYIPHSVVNHIPPYQVKTLFGRIGRGEETKNITYSRSIGHTNQLRLLAGFGNDH